MNTRFQCRVTEGVLLRTARRFTSVVDLHDLSTRLTHDDAVKLLELKRRELTAEPPVPLTPRQWTLLFARTAVPFFAFGLCDNVIMIAVGDVIDAQFGVVLGFSTMVAAGLGQAVSDGSGVTIQQVIENQVERRSFCDPQLSVAQASDHSLHLIMQVFRTVGIILGCLFALIPVVAFDTGNKPRLYEMLLRALPEDRRRELSTRGAYADLDAGAHVIHYGKPIDACYIITRGEMRIVGRSVHGEEVELCTQGPGSCIGVLELVFGHDSVADVYAVGKAKVVRISKDDFKSVVGNSPDVRRVVEDFVRADPEYVPYCIRFLKSNPSPSSPTHQPTAPQNN